MSRKSKKMKSRLQKTRVKKEQGKVRVAYHKCAFVTDRCSRCPYAFPHLVEVHEGFQACGGDCAFIGRHTHCVPTHERPIE